MRWGVGAAGTIRGSRVGVGRHHQGDGHGACGIATGCGGRPLGVAARGHRGIRFSGEKEREREEGRKGSKEQRKEGRKEERKEGKKGR
jgi:hypothetical protein